MRQAGSVDATLNPPPRGDCPRFLVNSSGIRDLWTVLTESTVLTGLTADVVDLVNPHRAGTVPGFLPPVSCLWPQRGAR